MLMMLPRPAATIAGPALGPWLYQALGRGAPFVVDVVTHVVGAWAILRLRTDFTPRPVAAPRHLAAEVAEGLRWLWRKRLVRDMALLTSVFNLNAAAVPLIVRAKELGASEAQIGLAFSLGGVGGILGALVGGRVQRRFGFGHAIVALLALHGLLFPLMAWAPGTWWLGAVLAGMMFVGPIYNVVQFSYRIAMIPDALQGRVNSSFRLVAHGLHPVGAAVCGVLLETAGTGTTVAFFAACGVLLVGLAAASRPLREAPQTPPPPQD